VRGVRPRAPRLTILPIIFLFLLTGCEAFSGDFKDEQSKYPRVINARKHTEKARDSLFQTAGLKYPPDEIFIRAFKHEQELELWARNDVQTKFVHIKTYPFTAMSGELGPKRAEGDMQIPEGIYVIDLFNPASKYLLSLRINYPNKSDKIRAASDQPGGSIFIHGKWVTIGCIPLGDFPIEELYIIAVDARNEDQDRIPVHIYPCRMYEGNWTKVLGPYIKEQPELRSFWMELQPIHSWFNKYHIPPEVAIESSGRYKIITPDQR
jgi:murein L,D-transpeptidase YafK